MNPRISIIVPCYNSEKFLAETLDCLKKQVITNWECIIVNDGSTDNSYEIAHRYEQEDKRYRVIDIENGGLANARNVGIKASHGKYILPLDADDLISPSYTKNACEYLENHPNTKLVYCKAEYFGDVKGIWKLPDYSFGELLWRSMIFCSVVYRRCDYDATIGYNTNMKYGFEDWDFLLSFLKPDDEVYRLPEIGFYYRKHSSSMTPTTTMKNFDLCSNQIIINHFDLYKPYLHNVIDCTWKDRQLYEVYNSPTYKVGNFILKPIKFIRVLLSRIKK